MGPVSHSRSFNICSVDLCILLLCSGKLKKQCTVLAVSHDLRELIPLVDDAWKMEPGGILRTSEWPPSSTVV